MGGQNSQDSILERRSLVWNDDGIVAPAVPDTFYDAETYKGKFFTRGCRGMIESIQVYCQGDGADVLTLWYSPHPCLGPVGAVSILPAAGWAWQDFPVEAMWNYDSLFIWVYEAEANVDWAYDTELPYDGHESGDAGATWADMAIRPFIRVVYTGETPGDVPVSGIINNIQIPNVSSVSQHLQDRPIPINLLSDLLLPFNGVGHVDLIIVRVQAAAGSEQTHVMVECDGRAGFYINYLALNDYGVVATTPGVTLTAYAVGGVCTVVLTKKFEFRRILRVRVFNTVGAQTLDAFACPTFLT